MDPHTPDDAAITPDLREAVTDLIQWWDELNNGHDPGIAPLARIIHHIKHATPHPHGPLGDDLQHILNPPHHATRIDHSQVLERLRYLTKPSVIEN